MTQIAPEGDWKTELENYEREFDNGKYNSSTLRNFVVLKMLKIKAEHDIPIHIAVLYHVLSNYSLDGTQTLPLEKLKRAGSKANTNFFNIQDSCGNNIFHFLCNIPNEYFLQYNKQKFQQFFQNGREVIKDAVGKPNNNGFTPLMIACKNGFITTAKFLLGTGHARPEFENANGQSALSVLPPEKTKELAPFIKIGIKSHLRQVHPMPTPPDTPNKRRRKADLPTENAEVSVQNAYDVFVALESDEAEFANISNNNGVNYFLLEDDGGNNLLHYLCGLRGPEYFTVEHRSFFKHPANQTLFEKAVQKPNNQGFTPLMIACRHHFFVTATLVLETKMSNPLHETADGVSALSILDSTYQFLQLRLQLFHVNERAERRRTADSLALQKKIQELLKNIKILHDNVNKAIILETFLQQSNNPAVVTCSLPAQRQIGGTCYAMGLARMITNVFEQMFPEIFHLNEHEVERLAQQPPRKKYSNCNFFRTDKRQVIETLTSANKCPIPARYYSAVLFYGVYFALSKKHGLHGAPTQDLFVDFLKDPWSIFKPLGTFTLLGFSFAPDVEILNKELDAVFKKLLEKFHSKLRGVQNVSSLLQREELPAHSWVNEFPEEAIRQLERGNYVGVGINLSANSWKNISMNENNNWQFDLSVEEENAVKISHFLVATGFQRTPEKAITVVNSWGAEWGNLGTLTINERQSEFFQSFEGDNHVSIFWFDGSRNNLFQQRPAPPQTWVSPTTPVETACEKPPCVISGGLQPAKRAEPCAKWSQSRSVRGKSAKTLIKTKRHKKRKTLKKFATKQAKH